MLILQKRLHTILILPYTEQWNNLDRSLLAMRHIDEQPFIPVVESENLPTYLLRNLTRENNKQFESILDLFSLTD